MFFLRLRPLPHPPPPPPVGLDPHTTCEVCLDRLTLAPSLIRPAEYVQRWGAWPYAGLSLLKV